MEDEVRDFYEENFQDSDEVTEWLVGEIVNELQPKSKK